MNENFDQMDERISNVSLKELCVFKVVMCI